MPEHAEVKISSEFTHKIAADKIYTKIEKSDVSKVKTDLTIPFNKFKIQAISRGKELKVIFLDVNSNESKEMLIGLGMSGTFVNIRNSANAEAREKFLKHSHLRFIDENENMLCFHDVRRFGKWKWVENGKWSSNRGSDPVSEYEDFKKVLINLYQEQNKKFDIPISEFLMDQKYWNGIGNYLRAEMIYRVPGLNPWTSFNDLSNKELQGIIEQAKECPLQAYALQGGQFKDWNNPFGNESGDYQENIHTWKKVYSAANTSWITDKNGRRFWFDKKWNSVIPERYLNKKHHLVM